MSFRVLTVNCQISSLEAIMLIKEKEKKKRLADYGVVNKLSLCTNLTRDEHAVYFWR